MGSADDLPDEPAPCWIIEQGNSALAFSEDWGKRDWHTDSDSDSPACAAEGIEPFIC